MNRECKSCGKKAELRFGHCWECAEAESIIDEGKDMRDKGMIYAGVERAAATPMEKLALLIQKGWHR